MLMERQELARERPEVAGQRGRLGGQREQAGVGVGERIGVVPPGDRDRRGMTRTHELEHVTQLPRARRGVCAEDDERGGR